MSLIKTSTSCCVSLFLCIFLGVQSLSANSIMQTNVNNFVHAKLTHSVGIVKSPMTLATTDFSLNSLEENEGRLLIRGRRGLRARRVH